MNTYRTSASVARWAAIVDIENIVIRDGVRLPSADGLPAVEFVRAVTQGMPVRVASGKRVLLEYMPAIAGLGWGLTTVPTVKDAADQALLAAGLDFIRCGVTDLVVVSGDHSFLELIPWVRLHVVSHTSHLSRRLRRAATTVTHLPPTALPSAAGKAAYRRHRDALRTRLRRVLATG